MNNQEFKKLRMKLAKTQNELALLLGTSLRTIRSYEQGWRNIPVHAERQLYFLNAAKTSGKNNHKPCWHINKCPSDRKKSCPAWEFKAGNLCWFTNGFVCEGAVCKDWTHKINICKKCKVWEDSMDK